MAETCFGGEQDGCEDVASTDTLNEDNLVKNTSKRCCSTSPTLTPPCKSPRTDSPTSITPPDVEEQPEADKKEMPAENSTASPNTARRKSWRRATLTRRSLPPLTNPYQELSRNISTSLSQQERLEKLLEASVNLAIERTQYSLQSIPNVSMDSFKKQVEHIKKECASLAHSPHRESHPLLPSAVSSSDPAVKQSMERVQKAIDSLQNESMSWEALLNQHRAKAEELERKVAQGQESGIAVDPTVLAQSSQYHFIQSKPDYQLVLRQQQPKLHTMEMIMDTQSKMVRNLLSIKEHSQLLIKETSSQLAAESGLQDLSSDVLRNLMTAPLFNASR